MERYRYISCAFAFATRVNRCIFHDKNVKTEFATLVNSICDKYHVNLVELRCESCYVILQVDIPCSISPYDFLYNLRKFTSTELRQSIPQLSHLPSLWERDFLIAPSISAEFINYFLSHKNIKQ